MISRSLETVVEHVFSNDPALNTKAKGYKEAREKHLKECAPASALPCKSGETPVIWKLRPLEPEPWLDALDLQGARQNYAIVQSGLVGVEGLVVNGSPVVLERKDGKLTRDSMVKVCSMALFSELALRILIISELAPFRA